jgi:hypothetical protein
MAWRHADDHPADPALAHRRQFRGDELVMPAQREWGPRVELTETGTDATTPEDCSRWDSRRPPGVQTFRK